MEPSEVFDYDLFAKYVAISELLGTSHNLRWINLRLYFNPKSNKFEPIAFDCFDGDDSRTTIVWYKQKVKYEYLLHPLLNDKEFIKLIDEYLFMYTDPTFVRDVFHENHRALRNAIELIKKDDKTYYFSKTAFFKRAKYLHEFLKQ